MKKLIAVILTSTFLASGCGGGGTSGAGGGGAVVAGQYVLHASLGINDSPSVDTIVDVCDPGPPPEYEETISTRVGTFTVIVENATSVTQGVFPAGLVLSSYTVSFIQISPRAPKLNSQTYDIHLSIPSPESLEVSVVIADVGEVIPEYRRKRFGDYLSLVLAISQAAADSQELQELQAELQELLSQSPDNYTVRVTMRGHTLSGHNFALYADATMEIGNFNRCG